MASKRNAFETKLKGNLSIGVGQNREATDTDGVHIDIMDENSNCIVIRVQMSYLDLCNAFRGRGNVDCTFRRNDSDVIGKKAEYKTVDIKFPKALLDRDGWRYGDEVAAMEQYIKMTKWLEENGYNVDGWEGDPRDAFNHHNVTKDGHKIGFVRYVEVK